MKAMFREVSILILFMELDIIFMKVFFRMYSFGGGKSDSQ